MKHQKHLFISFFVFILTISTLNIYALDSLKICAIRVEFQEDQNALTTGNGKFMLDPSENTRYMVDPPPHDKSYFQDQIIAVRNYYLSATQGKLYITGDVFPVTQNESYLMPQKMGYYSPNSPDEDLNDIRLAELFRDAIQIADNDEDINFSKYDLVTIFHAGVGKDVDIGYDETPQDIPSLFISTEFLTETLGTDHIAVTNNTIQDSVLSGIILPETESQANFELALTGIFAANIGSHLKLYDLFSPSEQATGVGRFGLMDSGQFNVYGLVPSYPMAYSRIKAQWDDAIMIENPQNGINIDNYKNDSAAQRFIYKIPVNSDEYFLLEYRGEFSINIDSVYYQLAEQKNEIPTYLEVLQTYVPDRIHVSDSTGVLLAVDNYDLGIGGAGILIWHIDESVIREKGQANRINDNPDYRAVDLEEADGSQDIGYSYLITDAGYLSELGTLLDFWYEQNPAPLFKNEFSGNSTPNSSSNLNRANSHITLKNFNRLGPDVMTFDYARDYQEAGFPIQLDTSNQEKIYHNLKPVETANNGSFIFTADDFGLIYAIGENGKGFFDSSDVVFADFENTGTIYLAATQDYLIAAHQNGRVNVYAYNDGNNDNKADVYASFNILSESIKNPPVIAHDKIYLYVSSGNINSYNFAGDSLNTFNLPGTEYSGFVVTDEDQFVLEQDAVDAPVVCDLDGNQQEQLIFLSDSNTITIKENDIPINYPDNRKIVSDITVGDIDHDGLFENVYLTDKSINAINYRAVQLNDFPVYPVLQNDEVFIGSPLLADLNNDHKAEIICITNKGQLLAYNSAAQKLDEFPLSISGRVTSSMAIFDIDQDSNLEIFGLNSSGYLNAFELPADFSGEGLWWSEQNYQQTNNLYIQDILSPTEQSADALIPAGRAYNYPNPNKGNITYIRYFLRQDASVKIKIFDLAGDLVDEFQAQGKGMIDNEISWNVSDIQSGVYLCRIEAQSDTETASQIIKIMIVH